MKLLVLLLLIAACAAQNFEWERRTVDLDKITHQLDIHKGDTEFLVKVHQCPSALHCIEAVRLEVLEMECEPNSQDKQPDYLLFQATSNIIGKLQEATKVTLCDNIDASEPRIIDFAGFEAEEILIRPVAPDESGWNNGTVWAKINIVSEIKIKGKDDYDWNLRVFRNEVIYLEIYLRNMFLFTSTLTILAVALLVTYFTLKINKMFQVLAHRNTQNFTATALPPSYHDVSNLPQYQQSKF